MNRLHPSALSLLLVAALAACTSSTPSPTASVDGSEAASPSAEKPTTTETASPTDDQSGGDAALEDLIPDEVGGVTLDKDSYSGDEFLETGGSPEAEAFFQATGVQPENVSVAYGFGFAEDLTSGASIVIFRAPGASSDTLLDAFKTVTEQPDTGEPYEWEPATVGGKNVEVAAQDDAALESAYLYAVGDILVVVGASDEATAAELLSGLP